MAANLVSQPDPFCCAFVSDGYPLVPLKGFIQVCRSRRLASIVLLSCVHGLGSSNGCRIVRRSGSGLAENALAWVVVRATLCSMAPEGLPILYVYRD